LGFIVERMGELGGDGVAVIEGSGEFFHDYLRRVVTESKQLVERLFEVEVGETSLASSFQDLSVNLLKIFRSQIEIGFGYGVRMSFETLKHCILTLVSNIKQYLEKLNLSINGDISYNALVKEYRPKDGVSTLVRVEDEEKEKEIYKRASDFSWKTFLRILKTIHHVEYMFSQVNEFTTTF
jgi:hypothetical protein